MTTEKELIRYFWNKFNLCYPVQFEQDPNSIFFFYDESYIRKLKICKLNKLNDKEIKSPSKLNGECLFKINKNINGFQCDFRKFVEDFMYKHDILDTNVRIYLTHEIKKIDYLRSYIVKFSHINYFNPFIIKPIRYTIYDRTRIKELVDK